MKSGPVDQKALPPASQGTSTKPIADFTQETVQNSDVVNDSKNNSDGELSAIWRIFAELNNHLAPKLAD